MIYIRFCYNSPSNEYDQPQAVPELWRARVVSEGAEDGTVYIASNMVTTAGNCRWYCRFGLLMHDVSTCPAKTWGTKTRTSITWPSLAISAAIVPFVSSVSMEQSHNE